MVHDDKKIIVKWVKICQIFMAKGFHEHLYFKFILNFALFFRLKFRAFFTYARFKGPALKSALGYSVRNINSFYWVTVFKIESITKHANSKSSFDQIREVLWDSSNGHRKRFATWWNMQVILRWLKIDFSSKYQSRVKILR